MAELLPHHLGPIVLRPCPNPVSKVMPSQIFLNGLAGCFSTYTPVISA